MFIWVSVWSVSGANASTESRCQSPKISRHGPWEILGQPVLGRIRANTSTFDPRKWNKKLHGMKCPCDHTGSWIVRKWGGKFIPKNWMAHPHRTFTEQNNNKTKRNHTFISPNSCINTSQMWFWIITIMHAHVMSYICCLWQYDETIKPGWTVWKTHHCEIIFGWFVHWGWLRRWARRSTKPCLIIWWFRWCFMGIPREHLRLNDIFSKRKARLVIFVFGRNNA